MSVKEALAAKGVKPIDLARRAVVDKATVSRWLSRRIPAERVVEVERLTGVPRSELRPDLYPPVADEAAE